MAAQRKYHPNPRPSCQIADGLSSPGFNFRHIFAASLTINSPAFSESESRHECKPGRYFSFFALTELGSYDS